MNEIILFYGSFQNQMKIVHNIEVTHTKCQIETLFYIPGSWHQYRFRQFYLDVSNSPATQTTLQRSRCYTDNTTVPNLPPNIIDIPCKQTARYVIVETTYDAPEDDDIKGAILEICEIEVYGTYAYDLH